MTTRICRALTFALCLGVLPGSLLAARGQETGQKNTVEQTSTEKGAAEKGTLETNDAGVVSSQRREAQKVVKVFYLPNLSSPTELGDVVNMLRNALELRNVFPISDNHTIIVKGTEEQITQAEKLIADTDNAQKKTEGQYRIEFKINELDDQKKLSSRSYVLLVGRHNRGMLRNGSRIQVTENEKGPQYVEVGDSIDCRVESETESTVDLSLTLEISGFGLNTPKDAISRSAAITQQKMDTSSTLELNKPTIVSTFTDPATRHTVQIEVTATRRPGRE